MTSAQTDLCFLSIAQAGALFRSRQLSPVELTQAFLHRIEAVDSKTRAYVTLLPDSALAEARSAEKELLRGRDRGPLHGIPLAHKDLYDTKGVRTTAQSKVLEHRVPTEDSTAIARLRKAGSVLLGKLAMHEFAAGGPQTSLFEQARNPWNLDHVTGGSSSGSGAAVAAGLCMGALGSDTGGSIRGPASFCGIAGLKPTYGRVSAYGVVPLSWSLDHCGPMTRTVEDTALMLQALAGHDPKDPNSSRMPVPDYSASLRQGVRGLTIGVPRQFIASAEVDADTTAAVDRALAGLEELGGRVEEVNIPSLEHSGIVNMTISLSEAFAYHKRDLQSQPQNFGDIVRFYFYIGALFSDDDYVQAQRARRYIQQEMARTMERVDLLATPTSSKPAGALKDFDPMALGARPSFMGMFNQTGMPAISIPCGFSSSGLPIGLQLAGSPFDEPTVLRAAHAYEQHARWFERRPPV